MKILDKLFNKNNELPKKYKTVNFIVRTWGHNMNASVISENKISFIGHSSIRLNVNDRMAFEGKRNPILIYKITEVENYEDPGDMYCGKADLVVNDPEEYDAAKYILSIEPKEKYWISK